MEGYPEITKDNWNGGIQIETQPNTAGYTEIHAELPAVRNAVYQNYIGAKDAYDYVTETCRCQYTLP